MCRMEWRSAVQVKSQQRIKTLVPRLQPLAEEFIRRVNDEADKIWTLPRNIEVVVSQALRDELYQMGLYTIGRTFERDSGVWTERPGEVVTRAPPSKSKHCRGEAFDIAVIEGGTKFLSLNPAVEEFRRVWLRFATIGKDLGLTPGAFWPHPDYPHYEI